MLSSRNTEETNFLRKPGQSGEEKKTCFVADGGRVLRKSSSEGAEVRRIQAEMPMTAKLGGSHTSLAQVDFCCASLPHRIFVGHLSVLS